MNMMEINSMNLNNNNVISKENNKDMLYNIGFKEDIRNKTINIGPFDKNKTINELINSYLMKIGRNDLIDNYDKYYTFLINATLLNCIKNKKINESNLFNDYCTITVMNKNNIIGHK